MNGLKSNNDYSKNDKFQSVYCESASGRTGLAKKKRRKQTMINLGHYSGNGHDLRYRRAKVDYILTGIALIPVLVEWGIIAYRAGAAGMSFGAAGAVEGIVALLVFLVLGSSMFCRSGCSTFLSASQRRTLPDSMCWPSGCVRC